MGGRTLFVSATLAQQNQTRSPQKGTQIFLITNNLKQNAKSRPTYPLKMSGQFNNRLQITKKKKKKKKKK